MIAPRTDNTLLPVEEVQQSFGGGQRDRDHPSLLAENEAWKLVNVEIREGGAGKTRRGWQSKTTVSPGSNYQGELYFDPPSIDPVVVQVNDGKFWKGNVSGSSWTRIGTAQLSNRTLPVSMAVVNNRIFIACGTSDNGRSWNGTDAEVTDEGNTNTDMPRGNLIWMQSDRLCMAGVATTATLSDATNYIFFSDINDGTTFDRTVNIKRVPTQIGEAVTAGAAYRNEEILVFTRNSSHLFNVTGSTVANFTRTTIDTRVGCIAHKSIVVVGDDAYFLGSDLHLHTIKRTIQDISLGVSVPISYFNDNLMRRIHEVNANLCAATFFDNYVLLSCPLDGDPNDGDTSTNTINSHVIAFDNLQQKQGVSGVIPACCGEWTNIPAGGWVVGYFSNKTKLYFVNSLDGNLHEMFNFEHDDGIYPPVAIKTRGFSWGAPNYDKTAHSGELQLLGTYGTTGLYYAKDDGTFVSHLTQTISSTASQLPIALPFVLTAAGILAFIFTRFYRKGRSRYWQLKITHENGLINLKQLTMRSFVEMIVTRSLQAA